MKSLRWLSVIVLALVTLRAAAGEAWKPVVGPLATRWTVQVAPDNAHREYPRPQLVRPRWLNLNGLWELGSAANDAPVPVGQKLPERILVPYPVESSLSGVMRHLDRLWYRRTFEVPGDWNGQRVLAHFQAVDWEAVVYVNGREVGMHRGGYDAFTLDITDALKPTGPQEIIVRVFDPTDAGDQPRGKQTLKPGGIMYTPTTGIWQTVWLEPVPAAHIGRLILTPDAETATIRLVVEGVGADAKLNVEAVAREGKREVAWSGGQVGREMRLTVPRDKLRLWSPESPFLYDLTVSLRDGNRVIDRVESYFALRKVDVAKDEQGMLRIRLNDRPLFGVGPLDQGFWPDGLYTAPTDEALRYDIEVTKRLGFNVTRKHVKVEPERWYYWCDKLGLLVWQDMPSGRNATPEGKSQFQTELWRMVDGLRNHPSIIMWVVFNEGWGQHDTERYVGLVKQWDPTRLVNNASGWTDKPVGDVVDMHRYPGPGAPLPEPKRAGVLGEFGGLGLGVDGHTWAKKTWGYRGTASGDELTRRYSRLLQGVWGLRQTQGLSAAVYTQITDVETECNGLLTYDRAVIKVDVAKVRDANQGRVPAVSVVVPTSQQEPQTWRYTFQRPAEKWFQPEFNDSGWLQGRGGFGREKTPGAVNRTPWTSADIWLRRTFQLPTVRRNGLMLLVHHDEDVEIYLNGVLAAQAAGYTTAYEELAILPAALAVLRPGANVLAVHCRQTMGGQYIDVGLLREE
jgi:hypothetical protein